MSSQTHSWPGNNNHNNNIIYIKRHTYKYQGGNSLTYLYVCSSPYIKSLNRWGNSTNRRGVELLLSN